MAVGPIRDERAPGGGFLSPACEPGGIRRPVRLAVTLVVTGGLAISGCAGTAGPPAAGAVPPAAAASPTPAATPAAAPTGVPPTTSTAPDPTSQSLRLGDEGPAVLEVQQRLSGLGYWLGEVDGHYGQLTRQAVMAFQKAEDLTRDGVAGKQTRGRLPDAARPQPQNTEGDLIEVDLDRQLLMVVRDGQLQWTFNTSTGNGEAYDRPSGGTGVARTPRGEFEIERQINGVRHAELGVLYRPKYFRGGIAVHGSGSIPAQPASHGCVRVTNAAMDLLWESNVATIGTPVIVH